MRREPSAETVMTHQQQQDLSQYMKNVKWSTMLFQVVPAVVSILIAIIGCYYGLKGDIKDSRIESKEQITSVATMLNRKIDSVQHLNDIKFNTINLKLEPYSNPKGEPGKIIFIPDKQK